MADDPIQVGGHAPGCHLKRDHLGRCERFGAVADPTSPYLDALRVVHAELLTNEQAYVDLGRALPREAMRPHTFILVLEGLIEYARREVVQRAREGGRE